MQKKQCKTCKERKPITEFHKDRAWLCKMCKVCRNKAQRRSKLSKNQRSDKDVFIELCLKYTGVDLS